MSLSLKEVMSLVDYSKTSMARTALGLIMGPGHEVNGDNLWQSF